MFRFGGRSAARFALVMTTQRNNELASAFPKAIRNDALIALFEFPEIAHKWTFPVRVAGELVSIPGRVYCAHAALETTPLSDLQKELVDCLLTRHQNGFVRQKHLDRIIGSENIWIPPFVIQLIGEYVIEILQVIEQSLSNLNVSVYEEFIWWNPEFMALTERRVTSYWNEHYRRPVSGRIVYKRQEYVGFRLLRFFRSLAKKGRAN